MYNIEIISITLFCKFPKIFYIRLEPSNLSFTHILTYTRICNYLAARMKYIKKND